MTRRPPSPADTITFHASHRPVLPAGDYTLTAALEGGLAAGDDELRREIRLRVAGERFALRKADLRSCYPPPGSHGEYTGVLPHLVFNRSTLPWERSPWREFDAESPSWLALLAFPADEAPAIYTLPATSLKVASQDPSWRAIDRLEDEQDVCCIDLAQKELVPLASDLRWLAHARVVTPGAAGDPQAEVAGDDEGAALDGGDESEVDATGGAIEVAVILGARVIHAAPGAATAWVVHLVSLEGAYVQAGQGHVHEGVDAARVRLVSLFHWGFTCDPEGDDFMALCAKLDRAVPLPLPITGDATAEPLLAAGSVPLVHHLRQGGRTVAWYRGPLVPALPAGEPLVDVALPARCADDLLLFDHETGMFDASYAVAWEHGRLRALADLGFATGLARWKRARGRRSAQARMDVESDAVARLGHARAAPAGDMPASLVAFLDALASLATLPPHHLVPDLRALPAESLRFVEIDPTWVECLLDGAMSVGRVTRADRAHDALHRAQRPPGPPLAGVLLRSALVAHFPALEVHGRSGPLAADLDTSEDPGGSPRRVLLARRLAPDILLVMFDADGPLDLLELGLPPEVLHFGLDHHADGLPLPLRSDAPSVSGEVWRDESRRVLDLQKLADRFKLDTIGDLALHLIQSAPLFRVQRGEVPHG